MKYFLEQLCPPILWKFLGFVKRKVVIKTGKREDKTDAPMRQELDIYWDDDFIEGTDTWGYGTVWNEIQFLMFNCRGRVLDIGCGAGRAISILSKKFPDITVYGCDISEKMIERAVKNGISRELLKVRDAANTGYSDKYFDYAYSIGSIEHFTEDGIAGVIKECCRITKSYSFHLIPVSRSGANEGWIKTQTQAYFVNNRDWWLNKFKAYFETVYILDSAWQDNLLLGKWFICVKHREIS